MKAGILTLHQADNFGAVLQAYALQQTLFDLGLDNEVLNTDFPETAATAEKPISGAAAVLIKRVEEENKRRKERFAQFRNQYLKCSEEYKRTEISQADSAYDLFITGSDQVWNMGVLGADTCYFLPFTSSEKRFSYAASFGGEELPDNMKAWCAEKLGGFTRISTREEQGKAYVRELTGRDAEVCLDPVFLPGKNVWENLAKQAGQKRLSEMTGCQPFYVLYMLIYDEELTEYAQKTASEKGAGLKVITGSFQPRFGFDAWSRIGVTDWLALFANAEGVFTNSFHGTAFALIFDKPLYATGPKGRLSKKSGRIQELLLHSGMEEAFGGTLRNVPEGTALERLGSEREASLQYLRDVAAYAKTL